MTGRNFRGAKWIWHPGDTSPRNTMVLMRGGFEFDGASAVSLSVCADSRYVIYLNGSRVGQGPVRAWPHHRLFDRYDITALLKPGHNVVAARVLSWGESNFQYLHSGKAGLLCEVAADEDEILLASDSSWRSAIDLAYDTRSRRVNIQMDFAEIYDASKAFGDWQAVAFDDSAWATVQEVGSPGDADWGQLSQKQIEQFSAEACHPKGIDSQRIVEPFGGFACFWLRWFFTPGDTSQNQFPMEGVASSVLRLDKPASATLRNYISMHEVHVNGQKVEFDASGYFHEGKVDLKQGDNLVTVRLKQGLTDYFGFGYRFDDEDVDAQWISPGGDPDNETGWIISDGSESGKLELESILIGFDPYTSPYAETLAKAVVCANAEELFAVLPRTESFPPMAQVEQCAMFDTVEPVVVLIESQKPSGIKFVEKPCRACFSGTEGMQIERETRPLLRKESRPTTKDGLIVEPNDEGDVELVLSMGRLLVGQFSLEINAPQGTVVDINASEEFHDGQPFYPKNMDNTVRYIAKEGRQSFRSFSRHGARWVGLTLRNFNRPVEIHDFHVELMTYPQARQGAFECSDSKLAAIWEMCAYTLQLCSEDTYTDCPTYERGAYPGDIRNEALIHYAVNGETVLPRHCLALAGQSLEYSEMVQVMAVSGWNCILPAWSLIWVVSCWEAYMYEGDVSFLEGIYPAVRQNLEGAVGFLNQVSLFETGEGIWSFFDWTRTTMQFYGVATFQQGWLVAALHAAAEMAAVLGQGADAEKFEEIAGKIKAAANKLLWSEEEQAYIDGIDKDGTPSTNISQQTQIVMYLCDMADGERKERIKPFLAEPKEGWNQNGTPFMEGFLLECLERDGRGAEIVSRIRDRWGAMVDMGLSTCLEMFPDPENPEHGRSNCHAWSATPGHFLPRIVLGVNALEPGFRKVRISPETAGLEWAKGRVPTPHGQIAVAWKRSGGEFCLEIDVPEAVEAEVILPKDVSSEAEPVVESLSKYQAEQLDGTWRIAFEAGANAKITT